MGAFQEHVLKTNMVLWASYIILHVVRIGLLTESEFHEPGPWQVIEGVAVSLAFGVAVGYRMEGVDSVSRLFDAAFTIGWRATLILIPPSAYAQELLNGDPFELSWIAYVNHLLLVVVACVAGRGAAVIVARRRDSGAREGDDGP